MEGKELCRVGKGDLVSVLDQFLVFCVKGKP